MFNLISAATVNAVVFTPGSVDLSMDIVLRPARTLRYLGIYLIVWNKINLGDAMRLSEQQRQTIKHVLLKHFGKNSVIHLFGSRVENSARGGDIDIYIEPDLRSADAIVEAKINALVELQLALGEQKIDLVINRQSGLDLPIYKIAQETGIPLWRMMF